MACTERQRGCTENAHHACVCCALPHPALQEYFGGMPWLAVPFQDDQLRSVLSRKFNVSRVAGSRRTC